MISEASIIAFVLSVVYAIEYFELTDNLRNHISIIFLMNNINDGTITLWSLIYDPEQLAILSPYITKFNIIEIIKNQRIHYPMVITVNTIRQRIFVIGFRIERFRLKLLSLRTLIDSCTNYILMKKFASFI